MTMMMVMIMMMMIFDLLIDDDNDNDDNDSGSNDDDNGDNEDDYDNDYHCNYHCDYFIMIIIVLITNHNYHISTVKLQNGLESLEGILGDNCHRPTAVDALMKFNYDIEKALDDILSKGSHSHIVFCASGLQSRCILGSNLILYASKTVYQSTHCFYLRNKYRRNRRLKAGKS